MTLFDIFRDEYAPLHRLGQKSVNCYSVTLRHFDRFMMARDGRPATLDNLTDLEVARFLADRERKTSTASAARDRVQLLALWRYCARKRYKRSNGELLDFPEVPIIRAPRRAPVAYTSGEIGAIIRAAAKLEGAVCGIPAGDWWVSLLLCLWESGERINATRSTKWDQVDLRGQRVCFRAETRKFRKADLDRRISKYLADLLAKRTDRDGLVWPWDRNPYILWYRLKAICKAAGVTYRGFHGIRRSVVSYCEARQKGAGQIAADHESGTTTKRSYIDPRIVDSGPDPVDLLPPLDLDEPERPAA